MAKDHKLFARNGGALNKHCKVTEAARPVMKFLLWCGVRRINTAASSPSHGQRSIKISRTSTGLEVDVRGEGGRQVLYAITDAPAAVEAALARKFREFVTVG